MSPGTGAGASDAPSSAPPHPLRAASPSPSAPSSNVSGARRDDGMLVVDGLDGAPSDPAVLHHAHRCRRVAVEESHPRIDDEDVKAVMGQHVPGGDVVEHAGDLTGECASRGGPAARRGRPCRAAGRRPSSCGPRRHRAGRRFRPRRRWPADTATRRRTPLRAMRVRPGRCRPDRSTRARWAGRRSRRTVRDRSFSRSVEVVRRSAGRRPGCRRAPSWPTPCPDGR